MSSRPTNPADLVVRSRLREEIHFPDLTERLALKLSAVLDYTARAHFGAWHKRLGGPDWSNRDGVFTPLVHVDVEVTDVPVDPLSAFRVQGETFLAKTVDAAGATHHLVREGRHTVRDASRQVVARARLLNVFTRYDADPVRRRVTELPPALGLGSAPSRVTELPDVGALVPADRRPDFVEDAPRVWHYGQTDANRHVNGMEYLRTMELYVADVLHVAGHDLKRLYFARARVVYRKPCFRGEGYRRLAWFRGEAPFVIAGAIVKDGDTRPAAAVELTLGQHDAGES
jgi:acyl-CoA thioesterase FadM